MVNERQEDIGDRTGESLAAVEMLRRHTDHMELNGGAVDRTFLRLFSDTISLIHNDLTHIRDGIEKSSKLQKEQANKLEDVKEILEAWDNAKGFVRTVQMIGRVMKWVSSFAAAGAMIYAFISIRK